MEKVLVIIASRNMDKKYTESMLRLKTTFLFDFDVALLSSTEDTDAYDSVFGDSIKYKFTMYNDRQFTKMCKFITYINLNSYDWFIKVRPEMFMLENLTFDRIKNLCKNSIHSRVRKYKGKQSVKYGTSVDYIECGEYDQNMDKIIWMDDAFYIFNKQVIENGTFVPLQEIDNQDYLENYETTEDDYWKKMHCSEQWEEFHTFIFNKRNTPMKIFGINFGFVNRVNAFLKSGHLNNL